MPMSNPLPRSAVALTWVLLAGCQGLFDPGTIEETCNDLPQGCNGAGDGGAEDTATPIDIAIDGVDPEYGPTDGGTTVTITGGPFAADATVTFDGIEGTVESWTETRLQVVTPAVATADWVAVAVQTSEGSGSLDHAFRYFADGTGLTRVVGSLSYTKSVGALASAGSLAHANLQFIEPMEGATWWSTITSAINTCERNWDPSLEWVPFDPGADHLRITRSDGKAIDLTWDGAEHQFNGVDGDGDVPADVLLPDTIWSIATFDSDELPTFSVSALATMPDAFELALPSLDDETVPVVKEESLDFSWVTSGADAIIIEMRLVDGGTGAEVERVSCAVDDDGRFHVPVGTFTAWEPGLVLYIKIGPAYETRGTIELDNSQTRVLASYQVSGAASTE